MHKSHLQEDLTRYDSSLTEEERISVRTARKYHLVTWVFNLLAVLFLTYKIILEFHSFFVGYVLFSTFSLVTSILYARRYKTWYGDNILVYFILLVHIVTSFSMFTLIFLVEFVPLKQLKDLKNGAHSTLASSIFRCVFFLIPLTHSFAIIYLTWKRKAAEHRVLVERGGRRNGNNKVLSAYQPQEDEMAVI